jgi:hypothetical protein
MLPLETIARPQRDSVKDHNGFGHAGGGVPLTGRVTPRVTNKSASADDPGNSRIIAQ